MSGAEALFAVGIICNAMQIITFGKDALHVYRSMRENGVTDPKLESYLALAATSYKNLSDQSRGPMPLTSDQQQILDICEKAHKGLQEFQNKFQALNVDEQSRKGLVGMARLVKTGVKTLFQSKELKDLEKDFQRYEHLFQARLIHRVCSQADASCLLTQEAFTRLEVTQQNVVIKLAEGHTQLYDLVSHELATIKDDVQKQHLQTRIDVNKHIHDTELQVKSHVSESSTKLQHILALRSEKAEDKKRCEQLLASLRYPEMNARKNQIATNFPNTCRWIFETARPSRSSDGSTNSCYDEEGYSAESSDELSESGTNDNQQETVRDNDTDSSASVSKEPTPFTSWLMSDSGMFWVSGKPASGKSTLMKFIATSPLTKKHLDVWRPSIQILTHYFFKAGRKMENNVRGMLLSLAHQVLLCRVDLVQRLWEEPDITFIHHKWSHADWSCEELEVVLCRALEASDDAFFILVDGLDESTEFEKHFWVSNRSSNILERFMKLNKVKICASSREEKTFCSYFEGVQRLRIHELTRDDINEFADSRLGALNFSQHWDRVRLLHEVTLEADGVFLWVSLILDSVTRACQSNNNIEITNLIERVKHAPKDIMELFQDIWERSGDDCDVASYRVTTSRYLSLALALTQCKEDFNSHDIFDRFQSLPVLAMASETREVESMLDPFRRITIPDLLDRCLKVEQDIPIHCCGFLEVSNLGAYESFNEASQCLLDYPKKNIRFVHRCAVDYLTNTESGASLLGACCWSKEDSMARLLGGYMIKSRLLNPLTTSCFFDEIINCKRYIQRLLIPNSLHVIFLFICTEFSLESSWLEFFFRTLRQWQQAGLFWQNTAWSYPGHPSCVLNPLDIQYLEGAAAGGSLPIISGLLAELSAQQFLVSMPAVVRGFSTNKHCLYDQAYLLSFTKLILIRFVGLSKEKGFVPTTGSRALCTDLSCRLYSWFICYLSSITSENSAPLVLDILHLFEVAIPDIEDWHRPFPLYLWYCDTKWYKYVGSSLQFAPNWNCFVVANFASAYRIICDLAGLESKQVPNHIRGIQFRFQPIVLTPDVRGPFYSIWPDEQDGLAAHMMSSLLRTDIDEFVAHRMSLPGTDLYTYREGNLRLDRNPCLGKTYQELKRYLIHTVGHMDDLPIHPWSPEWEIQDVDDEQNTKTGSGSEE